MIEIRRLSKSYENVKILNDIDYTVKKECVNVILGPSGCGKTTLLRIIAGLEMEYIGDIKRERDPLFSFVFQEDRLLNWKTVEENISFVLEKSESNAKEVVEKIANTLEISDILKTKVTKISGGQRRRVAIARAFAYESDIVLMDEPLQSLDFHLKIKIINDFVRLLDKSKKTVIMVTHDIDEALLLGDYISVLSQKPTEIVSEIKIGSDKQNRDITSKENTDIEKRIKHSLFF